MALGTPDRHPLQRSSALLWHPMVLLVEKADMAEADEQPSKRRRRSRRAPTDRKFECTHEGCGKSYSRAEHLYRHQLNRTFSRLRVSAGLTLAKTPRSRYFTAISQTATAPLCARTFASAIASAIPPAAHNSKSATPLRLTSTMTQHSSRPRLRPPPP